MNETNANKYDYRKMHRKVAMILLDVSNNLKNYKLLKNRDRESKLREFKSTKLNKIILEGVNRNQIF